MLGEYRDSIVVVGGWVPRFLCPNPERPHIGSMDVDLVLDHRKLTDQAYRTIMQLLLDRGYKQGEQPFIFHRTVGVGDRSINVEVDLLGGEYKGTGRTHRTQQVLDVQVRKARGADLNYPGGVDQVFKEFRLHLKHGLVKEGLQKLRKHFASVESVGIE